MHRRRIRILGRFTTGTDTTQGDFNDLDLQDVTRKEAQEIDRMYNQLESTSGHPEVTSNEPQGGDELDETGLAKEIDKENRLLDRVLDI
jgi:hypothetical protein